MAGHEILCIRGLLSIDGDFQLQRSYSTEHVRRWPRGEGPHTLELLAEDGDVLTTGPVQTTEVLRCEPGLTPSWRLHGYVALRDEAARVRLREEQRVLFEQDIPPAPELSLSWSQRRLSREDEAVLGIEHSPPQHDSAHVQIVYQWGERRFQTLDFVAPTSEYVFEVGDLPGGERCRLVVQYSNGLRSVGAATSWFTVEDCPCEAEIVEPATRSVVRPWHPIEVAGQILDPQRITVPGSDVRWSLLDEEGEVLETATGLRTSFDPRPAGQYTVRLSYGRDVEIAQETTIVVRNQRGLEATPADDWDSSA